jgi:ribosomal protein L22
MGRAYRERRHYSHLTVVVSSESRGGKAAETE